MSSVVASVGAKECLAEDEILALAAGALADAPAAEAHLATCATCSALLAAAVRSAPERVWGELTGRPLGPYELGEQIGAGGMGAVYRARDPRLGRTLAVKVLHDPSWERIAVEARAAAAIDHPAVVRIYDVGSADGIHYVAMELVEGESLRSVLAHGPLGEVRAHALLDALVDALVAAHARGVIHRDLKPENLLLARGELRILDFGLAKITDDLGARLDESVSGAVLGTPGYLAPEQARGESADARVDLFAAGAIAYECATGRRAFPGATAADRISATLRDTPDPAGLGALATVVLRCLAREPRDRFQTALDLQWALRTPAAMPAALDRPPSRRGVLLAGAAATGVGLASFVLGSRWRRAPAIAPPPTLQPLTHRTGRVFTARFTHDGHRVVYSAAWDAEPLHIFVSDLDSGETQPLDLPSADILAVSARGELAVSVGQRFVDHQSARGHLAVLPLAGGAPRLLADDVQDADFAPEDRARWRLPPGSLAVLRATAHTFRLELPLGELLVEDPGWLTDVRVSPDGAHVAYLQHPQTNDDGGALVVLDRATKQVHRLATDWMSLAGLAWDPAGDALWFTGSRDSLTTTLYRATLAATPAITAIPVPAVGRMRIHDLAADRRALVTSDEWRLRAMAGERDCSLPELSYVSDLSADGAQVVIGELRDFAPGNGAFLVPFAGGRTLRLGAGFPLAISPAGAYVAVNLNRADHLVVYSTTSGEAPALPTPGFVTFGRWLDETALLGLYDHRLWRLARGEAPIALTTTGGRFALDPTRARCAYVDATGVLRVLDVATRAVAIVPGPALGLTSEVCGWLASPDAIVVRTLTTPIVLDRVDPATGARTRHLEVQPPPMGLKAVDTFVLHADGTRFAYSYGQELSQLFVMSGLRR